MSIETPGVLSPTNSCTDFTKNQLVEIAQKQFEIIQELQNEISEIKEQLADHARQDALDRRRISENESRIDEIESADTSDTCEDQSSDSHSEGEDAQSTALEQVCALPEENAMNSLSANQERARSVARRIDEYGKPVPAGVAITSSRLRDILSGLEDKRIHRQTVQRVADFLKRFGDGEIDTKETRGGNNVVVFSESIVEAITSVVTGNKDPGVTPAVI
jgi:hypothetical protein